MNNLKLFTDKVFGEIRTLIIDGEPWFIAKDICRALEIDNVSQALARLDNDEKNTIILNEGIGNPEKSIINEAGLYALVLSSRKPEAKDFKRWITHTVLPSIRRHGMYATPQTIETMLNDPDTMIAVLTALKQEREKIVELQLQAEQDKPKVLFADAVTASKTSILVGEFAKILKQNGVDTGQNRLYSWLRENGYLHKGGSEKNLPTQKSANLGLFEIQQNKVKLRNGDEFISRIAQVTGKGQAYFVKKFIKTIERDRQVSIMQI